MVLQRGALWAEFVKKNPHWLTENVTFTPAGILVAVGSEIYKMFGVKRNGD